MVGYLDKIEAKGLGTTEIGFTGSESLMNSDILAILRLNLSAGHSVQALTHAMRPMMRPHIRGDCCI